MDAWVMIKPNPFWSLTFAFTKSSKPSYGSVLFRTTLSFVLVSLLAVCNLVSFAFTSRSMAWNCGVSVTAAAAAAARLLGRVKAVLGIRCLMNWRSRPRLWLRSWPRLCSWPRPRSSFNALALFSNPFISPGIWSTLSAVRNRICTCIACSSCDNNFKAYGISITLKSVPLQFSKRWVVLALSHAATSLGLKRRGPSAKGLTYRLARAL